MNKRVQLSRRAGWKKPAGAVVVSRPSIYGNPFSAKFWGRRRAVQLYRWMMVGRWKQIRDAAAPHMRNKLQEVMLIMELMIIRKRILCALPALRSHDLACWCPADEPCHADVLLALCRKGLKGPKERK